MRDFAHACAAIAALAFLLGFVSVLGVAGIAELGLWVAGALVSAVASGLAP